RAILVCGLVAIVAGSDWPGFRGPGGTGTIAGESVPQEVSAAKNVAWRADLPGRGLSSPIIIGNHVFLTASSGRRQDRLHVFAFTAKTGRQLWERSFWATGPTDSHPKNCMAAPTPVSNGRLVAALFGTGDLVCLDLDGNLQWFRSLYEENTGATDG